MEIYNGTGVTKTSTLRVTKSIGALVIASSDLQFSDLANERINVHIERANGDNEYIATDISLSAFVASSVFGEGKIIDNGTSFSALCELASMGAIPLQENENIVISLTELTSTKNYALHGIEMPVLSSQPIVFAEKVFLNGQKNRSYDVVGFDEGVIIGDFEKVRLTYPTNHGSITTEHSKLELRAISADLGLLRAGSTAEITQTVLSLVGVTSLEIFANNQVNIVLRDIKQ